MKNQQVNVKQGFRHSTEQLGFSLVVVMIFLVILSSLAITAMQGSTFSARIAGNEADRTLAFQAAEAALRDAENDISCTSSTRCRTIPIHLGDEFDVDCPAGRCIPNLTSPIWEDAAVWSSTSVKSVVYGTYTDATALAVVSRQPRYILEYFKQGDGAVYRVTAVGFGANDSTRAILQTAVKAI